MNRISKRVRRIKGTKIFSDNKNRKLINLIFTKVYLGVPGQWSEWTLA